MGANVLHLKDGTKDHFMGFLRQEFPHLVEGYKRLYPGAYAPADYVHAIKGVINGLRRRHAVGAPASLANDVEIEEPVETAPLGDTQPRFEWAEP
jgi:hypothetical protein